MVSQDPCIKSVYPLSLLIAYIQQENTRESPIKARVYQQNTRDKQYLLGMKKSGKYLICNSIKDGKFY